MPRKLLLPLLLLAIAGAARAGDTSLAAQVKEQKQTLQNLAEHYARKFPAYADDIHHVSGMALKQTCSDENIECNRVLLMYVISAGSTIGYRIGDRQNSDRLKASSPSK